MAGTVYRPVRELVPTDAVRTVENGLARTGWEEVSLVSLSSSDYSGMMPLLEGLKTVVEPGRVAISLPSQRPDAFTGELAEALSLVKKTGLTFAVEAGSHRLRRVINKDIADDDILRTAAEVIERGWRLIKFYFMIGLPTETDEDVDGIERLARDVFRLGRKSHRRFALNLNVSPFVPKSHTPFQWVAQDGVESLNEKGRRVKERLREGSIRVKLSDPQSSLVEGVLARGDRRLGAVIEEVWKNGGKLDGWSRFFRYDLWRAAFDRTGLDPDSFTGEISETAPLPWGHIDTGVDLDFLRREWNRARQERLTPDCRVGPCQVCGLFPFPVEGHKKMVRPAECSPREAGHPVDRKDQHGRRPKRSPRPSPVVAAFLFRFKYAKLSRARFLGHLDTVRALTRALRTIEAPLAYSQGYNPHPKIAFGPPLPLGIESESEYFDVQFHRTVTFDPVLELNQVLPEGLRIIDGRRISKPRRSLTASIEFATYRVEWPNGGSKGPDSQDVERLIAGFMAREKAPLTRPPRKEDGRSVTLDLRPLVLSADLLHSEPPAIRFVLAASPAKTARPLEVLQLVLGGPIETESLRLVREEVFRIKPDGDRLTPVDPEF
jgi:radical SAM-linked protein